MNIIEDVDGYGNRITIKTIGNRKYVTGWYTNGGKMYEEEYNENEKKKGKWIAWYEDGTKSHEEEYKNGEKEGKWTDWYDDGKYEREYKDGNLITRALYKNGTLRYEERKIDWMV